MRLGLLILCLAAMPVAAPAARPTDDPPAICTCDPPMPVRKLPGDEALALGTRLAKALHPDAIARRVNQLIDIAEVRTGRPPEPPTYPNGPLRAVSPLRPPLDASWGLKMQERAAEHAGLAYAWRYPLAELRQMVPLFESAGGKRYLEDRGPAAPPVDVEQALASADLDEDLLSVVCGIPLSADTRGPHHDFARLHRPVEEFGPTIPPRWCASVSTAGSDAK